tara:strand:- start:501 stop:761 length:261 start_codon:yes stop_codon:yes gene_type:complete
MDQDYMKETIAKVLSENNINKKGLAEKITNSIKKDILRFHKFQNGELTRELLIKQTRIEKLESRIDKKNIRSIRKARQERTKTKHL